MSADLKGKITSNKLIGTVGGQTNINVSMQSTGIYITSITQNGNTIYIHLSNGKIYSFSFTIPTQNSIAVNGTIIEPDESGIIQLIIPTGKLANKDLILEEDLDSSLKEELLVNTSINIASIENDIITLKSEILETNNLISNGTQTISFSKIATTGKVSDLIQEEEEYLVLDCGGAE